MNKILLLFLFLIVILLIILSMFFIKYLVDKKEAEKEEVTECSEFCMSKSDREYDGGYEGTCIDGVNRNEYQRENCCCFMMFTNLYDDSHSSDIALGMV